MSYYDYENSSSVGEMVGLVFTSVRNEGSAMIFENDSVCFTFYHSQDCCESVYIDDVVGDLTDLENSPLLISEESSGEIPAEFNENDHESVEWTFYKFATRKGYVDVRWMGESNGYYSTGVSLGREMK